MLRKLSLLLVFGLLIACGDDDSTSPTAEQPPEVVQPPMTFTGPNTTDPAAIPVQSYVSTANAMTGDMASFLDIVLAATGTTAHYADGVWTWTYTEGAYTYTVTCEYQSDGWYWTLTVDGGIYSNCRRGDGFTSASGSSGWWKFYECTSGSVVFSATWASDESSGNIDWYIGDFNQGGNLVLQSGWSVTGSSQTTTLTTPGESRLTITESTDGSGDLYVYDWNETAEVWDLTFEAHWNANGSGWYTNHLTGNTVNWG